MSRMRPFNVFVAGFCMSMALSAVVVGNWLDATVALLLAALNLLCADLGRRSDSEASS